MRTDASLPPSVGQEPLRSTYRAAHATLLMLLAMLLAIPTVLAAQDTTVIVVNPTTQKAKWKVNPNHGSQHDSLTFSLPKGTLVRVQAAPVNSALYRCVVGVTAAPVAAPDSISAWLSATHDYFPLLLAQAFPPRFPGYRPQDPLSEALNNLEAFTHGPDGIAGRQQWLLAALDSLSHLKANSIGPYVKSLNGGDTLLTYRELSFPREDIRLTTEIVKYLSQRQKELNRDTARLDTISTEVDSLKARSRTDVSTASKLSRAKLKMSSLQIDVSHLAKMVSVAQKALQDAPARLEAAYALERLAHRVLTATNSVTCKGATRMSSDSIKTVTASIVPDNVAEVKRLNDLKDSVAVRLKLVPEWRVRVAVSVSLIAAPRAEFGKPGTVPYGSADSAQAASVGQNDYRFTYAVTLGLEWRLGFQSARLWLPDIPVNPSSDVKAIGLGAGISVNIVKLSIGAIWTRHTTFSRSTPSGALLASADALKTSSAFSPSFYMALSLLALPGILH